MTQAKIRIDPALSGLSRSAWENLIYEANLGSEMTEIATKYFIHKQCQIDIAIDKDIDRKTVNRKLGVARRRVEQTYYDRLKS